MTWVLLSLWRQRAAVVAALAIGLVVVLLGLLLAPKSYEAQATVSVIKTPTSNLGVDTLTYIRRALVDSALGPESLTRVQQRIDSDRTRGDLAAGLEVRASTDLPVITVVARDPDQEAATQIADAMARVLVEDAVDSSPDVRARVAEVTSSRMFATPRLGPLLFGGVAGVVLLAVLLALVRDRRREGLASVMEVENAAIAPMLGLLHAPADLRVMASASGDAPRLAELAHLADVLGAEYPIGPARSIVFGALGADELDVWVAVNLATTWASSGRRVALVDGRLGDDQDRTTGPSPDTRGFAEALRGAPVRDLLMPGPTRGLWILPAGNPRPGGAAAREVGRSSFVDVLAEVTALHDVVLVLAPPLDGGEEALRMVGQRRVVLVLPEDGVEASRVHDRARAVRRAGGLLEGVVMVSRAQVNPAALPPRREAPTEQYGT